MNFGALNLWYWMAYLVVTLIGIGHTVFNWKVLKMENVDEAASGFYRIEAYAKTVPYHPVYNILLWPIFAYIYLVQVSLENLWRAALLLGTWWMIITIVVDLIGWVLIKHPWRMSFKEMYVDYQPWLALIYVSIFISPLVAVLVFL